LSFDSSGINLSWDIPEQEFEIGDMVMLKSNRTFPAAIFGEDHGNNTEIVLDLENTFEDNFPRDKCRVVDIIKSGNTLNKTNKNICEVQPLNFEGVSYIIFENDLELVDTKQSSLSKQLNIPIKMLQGVSGSPFFYENDTLYFGRKESQYKDIPDTNIDLTNYQNALVGRVGENAVVFWSPDYIPMENSDQFDKLINCLDRLKQNDFVEHDIAVIFANDPTPYTIDDFLGV
jgi:hypothetical protein